VPIQLGLVPLAFALPPISRPQLFGLAPTQHRLLGVFRGQAK